ncbi:T9SS type A sorting domain-containing protein [uncultured Draconibacterium sp.]|uniref:T9SS type A sorting domain-containing protein n=1 Tax=uncultured Draconibacterium sp. TaxID=1573823 RepID=UPI002AA6ACD0|nr:T9SS type A sorting domain-containing protein [uncultured Draconibacterium sp.]
MKNFTIIFLVLLPIFSLAQEINIRNFKVNETVNREFPSGTRFDFEFEIQGDYTYGTYGYHQIDLRIYKESVSSANYLGLIYWNREDDYDIYYPTYTKKETWLTTLKDYETFKGQKFILEVKYAGLTKTYTYTCEPPIQITQVSLPQTYTSGMPTFYYNNNHQYKIWYKNFSDETKTIRRVYWFFLEDEITDNATLSYHFQNGNTLPNYTYYSIPFNGTKNLSPESIYNESSYINGNAISLTGSCYLYTVVFFDDFNYDYRVDNVYVTSQSKSANIAGIEAGELVEEVVNTTTVYPNPSNGYFNVHLADKDYSYLKVLNTAGQEVYKENIVDKTNTAVQIPNPTSGVYFIELSNDKNKEQIKIIVK